MTREDIREGVFKIILDNCWTSESEEACILGASLRIMEYLHSKGVVRKVDRDNKNCRGCVGTGMIGGAGINDCCPDCNGTGKVFCVGYVAVESLI